MKTKSKIKRPTPEMVELLRRTGSHNKEEAMAAMRALAGALEEPLRQGVLSGDITGDIFAEEVHSDPTYWRVRFEIQFRMKTASGVPAAEAWDRQRLNEGFRYLSGSDLLEFTDSHGKRVSQPKLLAADGTPLGSGADPVWLGFRMCASISWAAPGSWARWARSSSSP